MVAPSPWQQLMTEMCFVTCAACTADGKGITYNEHINVAVAVTMPDGGLITPVLKVRHLHPFYSRSTAAFMDWLQQPDAVA